LSFISSSTLLLLLLLRIDRHHSDTVSLSLARSIHKGRCGVCCCLLASTLA